MSKPSKKCVQKLVKEKLQPEKAKLLAQKKPDMSQSGRLAKLVHNL